MTKADREPGDIAERTARRGVTRRGLLIGASAAGGLVALGYGGWTLRRETGEADAALTIDPTVFLQIDPDRTVTLLSKHLEMGQGIMTGLATIVADEMDADWEQMRVALAPANYQHFRSVFGRQGTAASTSTAGSWEQMRLVGAAARHMMVAAAAETWGVPAREITVTRGIVRAPESGRKATFGELAAAAAARPVPVAGDLTLKAPADWTLIGRNLPRVDAPAKIDGTALFGMDVRRPGMVRAMIARPPRFGDRLASVDAGAALQVRGVLEVVEIPTGVAVLASDTWSAMQGRAALRLSWDNSEAEMRSSDAILDDYRARAAQPGTPALTRGDADAALADAAQVLEFEFAFPYLAHAAMEPLNAVIETRPDGAEIWAGCQLHTLDQIAAARVLGLERPEQVTINTVYCGSSFGRRADPLSNWIVELASVALESRLGRPIHLVWSREDDLRGGQYRPMALHRGRAGLDAAGALVGWSHRVVCKSIVEGTPWSRSMGIKGVDRAAVGGLIETSYDIPNFAVDWHNPETPVTVGFWRSVGDGQTGFVVETVIDELAHAAKRDPVDFRLALLGADARQRAVLEAAAERAGWGETLAPGRGRGVAVFFDAIARHRTYVAMVADVTVADAQLTVDRLVVAVDCGLVINPDIVVSQVESSISFALSTVLRNRISLRDGLVEQSNFHDYEPTRLSEMPRIEVHLVPADLPPSGIGEAAVSLVGPAVGNAVFSACGRRLRSLPLDAARSLAGL